MNPAPDMADKVDTPPRMVNHRVDPAAAPRPRRGAGAAVGEVASPYMTTGEAADGGTAARPSRAALLAEALGRPEAYSMGVEFKMFARLLVAENGVMHGTYQELGARFGTDARNVRNWAEQLRKAGHADVCRNGSRQVEIRLREPWFAVAAAGDEVETPVAEPEDDDPELADLIRIYRTAKETGASIKVKMVRSFGNERPA